VAKRCKDHRSFKEIIDVANVFMNYDITYYSLPDNTNTILDSERNPIAVSICPFVCLQHQLFLQRSVLLQWITASWAVELLILSLTVWYDQNCSNVIF
jgi:hypothetical protein